MSSPSISTAAVLLASIWLVGCVRRDGRNMDCKWPEEADAKRSTASARSLHEDAEFAEELAIEYMDAGYGPRSGHFQSQRTANQALNACLASLLDQVGRSHNVPPEEVDRSLARRSLAADLAMSVPIVVLYAFLAAMLAGRLLRRYPVEDGWIATLVMIAFASIACGAGGMLVGEQLSVAAENIRVGTGHLSYRLGRLLWPSHEFDFFVLCVALFWCAAAVKHRLRRPRT
ncbi:MAG TPA: hypothetical protein VKB88_12665 [Bryobacteraceae bacterium]|nr:hypothetical protein [Bryobacteraceae bacterium]